MEPVYTLILGAGPSRLATGYMLARAGLKPAVLENAAGEQSADTLAVQLFS